MRQAMAQDEQPPRDHSSLRQGIGGQRRRPGSTAAANEKRPDRDTRRAFRRRKRHPQRRLSFFFFSAFLWCDISRRFLLTWRAVSEFFLPS